MIVVSVVFLVITADLAFAIGKPVRGNLSPQPGHLSPLSEPLKAIVEEEGPYIIPKSESLKVIVEEEGQNVIPNSRRRHLNPSSEPSLAMKRENIKRENMKKSTDITLSFLENEKKVDDLASKFIKNHGFGEITEGHVKENMKRLKELLKTREHLKTQLTQQDVFEFLVADLTSMDPLTSTHAEFHFCKAIVEDMPDDFLTTDFKTITDDEMNATMSVFGVQCEVANSENPLDLNPFFIDEFELCSHLPDVLKLHLSFGLPLYVESNADHFCTYVVDMIFPSEIEQPCMFVMEQMQYQYAIDNSLAELIPYPNIALTDDFEHTFKEVCTSKIMDSKTEDFCSASVMTIKEISEEAVRAGTDMTMLTYTDQFCVAIDFSLPPPHPEQETVDIHPHPEQGIADIQMKFIKHSTRNAVSRAFSLAQGYRHGLMDSTGSLIQSTSEDLQTANVNLTCNCPRYSNWHTSECYNTNDDNFIKAKTNGPCCLDQCYQRETGNNGIISQGSGQFKSACSGRANTNGVSSGIGVGPLISGGGYANGYGIFLDEAENGAFSSEQYVRPPGRRGSTIRKWAEQNFYEHCIGVSAGGFIPTDFDDIVNIGMNFESGYFYSFDNVPGFTKVETFSGSFLIFESSASMITCCTTWGHLAHDCSRCGSGMGLGIFFPPTWGDVDYSFEACYAYPTNERKNSNFDMGQCQFKMNRLEIDCSWNGHYGPYPMQTIHATIWGTESLIFKGTLCQSGDSTEARKSRYIDFAAPDSNGGLGAIVFRNNKPGQITYLDYFKLVRCKTRYSNRWDHYTKQYLKYECKMYRPFKSWGVNNGNAYHVRAGKPYWAGMDGRVLTYVPVGNAFPVPTYWGFNKCGGWGFNENTCCNGQLVENNKGCYWYSGQCQSTKRWGYPDTCVDLRNGEQVCEGHGYSAHECWSISCCQWDDGECWSSVGTSSCKNGEEACENNGFDPGTCSSVGCCHWDHGCWSSVGPNACKN